MVLLCSVCVFSACSDDDENTPTDGGAITILPKKVVQIVQIESGSSNDTTVYAYDTEGRIKSVKSKYNTEAFQYTADKIVMTSNSEITTFNLKDGKVTTEVNEERSCSYEYNGVYLKKVPGEDSDGKFLEEYIIENGNVKTLTSKYEGDPDEFFAFTYGTTLNNANVDLFAVCTGWEEVTDARLLGICGKRFLNLPSKVINSGMDDDEPFSDTYDYTYEVKDGYVTKVTEVDTDSSIVYMITYQP